MGKDGEFVGKVGEAWFPSVVFESDSIGIGGAYGGGTVRALVGGC